MRTVLITGASSGIGAACARTLASEGNYRLLLCARREARLLELKSELLKDFENIEIHTFVLDVRNRDEVFDRIENLPSAWKNIDVLINNAGLSQGLDAVQDGNPDDWDRMIDTNVKGLLYVTRAVTPLLKQSQNAHIVNLGSIAGDRKSTRLNSSHVKISYAVFCLKKKKLAVLRVRFLFFLSIVWTLSLSTIFPYTTLFRS